MANPMGKSRSVDKPYIIVEDHRVGFVYRVLKAWQQDPDKSYARWFCDVKSPYTGGGSDMGDTYVADVTGQVTYIDPSLPLDVLPRHLRSQFA